LELESHGSWLHFLFRLPFLPSWLPEIVLHSALIILILGLGSYLFTRRLQKIPSKSQSFLEIVVIGLDNFVKGIIPQGSRYTPLIGSFFIYILVMNLFGLIPGMLSPTSNLNTTIALALVTLFSVQYFAIKKHGVLGWLKHFAGEPLGMAPLMFPVHVISELAKPFSLCIRLFANIFGEDMSIMMIIIFLPILLKYVIPAPTYIFMVFMAVFTSIVQALIFSVLSAVYIGFALGEEGD